MENRTTYYAHEGPSRAEGIRGNCLAPLRGYCPREPAFTGRRPSQRLPAAGTSRSSAVSGVLNGRGWAGLPAGLATGAATASPPRDSGRGRGANARKGSPGGGHPSGTELDERCRLQRLNSLPAGHLDAEAQALAQRAIWLRLLPMRATRRVRSRSTSAAGAVHVRVRAMALPQQSRQRRGKPGVQRGAQRPLGQTAMFNIAWAGSHYVEAHRAPSTLLTGRRLKQRSRGIDHVIVGLMTAGGVDRRKSVVTEPTTSNLQRQPAASSTFFRSLDQRFHGSERWSLLISYFLRPAITGR